MDLSSTPRSVEYRERMMAGDAGRDAAAPRSGSSSGGSWMTRLVSAASAAWASCWGEKIVFASGREVRKLRLVAEGGYAMVYLVEDIATGEQYACKQLRCQLSEQLSAAQEEIALHRRFQDVSPFIAPVLDYAIHQQLVFMLFPFFARGSCQDALLRALPAGPFFDVPTALKVFICLARGVATMHHASPPLAHRDVCPRNVMMTGPDTAVLIDLGSARPARVHISSRAVALQLAEEAASNSSMPYRAPELWDPPDAATVDERTDIWSLGATLYALVFGYSPFESTPVEGGGLKLAETTHLRCLNGVHFPAAHSAPAAFCDFIRTMTALEAAARPDIDAVLARATQLLQVQQARTAATSARTPTPRASGGETRTDSPAAATPAQLPLP